MEMLLETPEILPTPPISLPLHKSLFTYAGPKYIESDLPTIWEEIIESPWWKRSWVFQEFMVSTDAIFMSMDQNIHWKAAQLALERYIGPAYQPLAFDFLEFHYKRKTLIQKEAVIVPPDFDARGAEEAAGKVWFMLKTKAEWKDTTAGLTYLLARSRNSKASEDRDRIYALLGLADPGYAIVPDYSASCTLRDVLIETTKNIILFENTLDVLSVISAPPLARRPGLPSWVVDWTREEIAGPPNKEYLNTLKHTPRGKGPAIASFRKATHPETRQETTIMEVTGTFVQEFESVGRSGQPFLRAAKSEVLEVWDLCGSPVRFLLRHMSYGYQIVRWVGPDDLEIAPKYVPKVTRPARPETVKKLARAETVEPRVISVF
ncbi:HET domain-containing protein [Fusarium sp. LHS14.1]|nr:HET domain-containing protein [Fusarium sp. LHS14.1]